MTTTGAKRFSKASGASRVSDAIRWIVAAFGALVMIFPVYWMFATALKSKGEVFSRQIHLWPTQWEWSNFSGAWNSMPFTHWFINSFAIALIAVVITVFINLLAGYTFAKYKFWGRDIIFFAMLSTLMIPIQAIIVPEFLIISKLGWVDSYWGVVFPRAAEAFGIFMVRQFMMSIPDDLIEAARLDGASEFTMFRKIILPLSKPAIAVLVIFTFMWRWNDFEWPIVALQSQHAYTVPLGLNLMQGPYGTNWPYLMAMALVSIVPILIIFVLFQRYFVQGIASTGLK